MMGLFDTVGYQVCKDAFRTAPRSEIRRKSAV